RASLPAAEIVMIGGALAGYGDGGSAPDHPENDLTVALRAAAGRARVLGVAGGDGTVNAAAVVALEAGLPLAIAPAGTLNHFAGDLGVMTVDDLIVAVRDGTAVAVDVGRIDAVNGGGDPSSAIFLNTASLIGYPEMVMIRERFERRIGKWPAMIVALVRVLRDQPPTRLEIDGRMRCLWLVFIGNGRYSPDGFAPTYRDRLDSGLLDVRLVDATEPWSRSRLVFAVLTGRLGRSRVYQTVAAHSVRIVAPDGPLPYAKDGEVGDTVARVKVVKNPNRLVVYRPAE
ncbi:MAG: diacylglycerol/lipid kinase family protein, partial [Frankia sp.]